MQNMNKKSVTFGTKGIHTRKKNKIVIDKAITKDSKAFYQLNNKVDQFTCTHAGT